MKGSYIILNKKNKRKMIFEILRKLSYEYKISEMNILIDKELNIELSRLKKSITDIDTLLEKDIMNSGKVRAYFNNSIFNTLQEEKINLFLKTKKEINPKIFISEIREIINHELINSYELIQVTLLALIDYQQDCSIPKLLAAYKSFISSYYHKYHQYSKRKSQEIAAEIAYHFFMDEKGTNYPKVSNIYHGKYISFPIAIP